MMYKEAGQVLAQALVDATEGPVYNFDEETEQSTQANSEWVAAELTAGLLYGVTERENLDALATCFSGADEFVTDVNTGFNMITSHTYAGLMNGAFLLMETLVYLPDDLRNCVDSGDDINAIE